MKPDQIKKSLAVIMPLMLCVACGGGSTISSTPTTGEANAGDNAGANENNNIDASEGSSASEQTITGRVADGYLQGAIVCIDINENGQCDPDEPQVESSEGGNYSLDMPANAAGKPILAEVPATAIDEDTGLPIGKELLLSTPGDKPGFVSPITTLVHQELKNNPNLNTEDAAAAVLETLGLPDEEDASLFTDYVANSEDANEQRREKFEFLHQTARVVASMMDEIHTNVEATASAEGIDVESEATAAAIRDLVRDEIRAQLPEISAAVAERILQIEAAPESANGLEIALTDKFDPDSIAGNLGDSDLVKDIADKIDAAKGEAPIERAKMDELLAAGIYIIDVDCERLDEGGTDDGLIEPAVQQPSVILNDEGVPEVVHMPEFCTAEYSHIITEAIIDTRAASALNDASAVGAEKPAAANLIVTNYYYGYDDTSGSDGWVMEEQTREEHPHLLTLVDGNWVPAKHEGPFGMVEFTADGAAVMNTDEGKLLVYASNQDLSGKSVLHHILNRGANDALSSLVDESKRFPDGASAHQLLIKRKTSLTVMFNWSPEEDDTGVDYCAEFGGNCNVVYVQDDASYSSMPLASFDELYDGAVIDAVAFDNMENLPVDVALHVKPIDFETTAINELADDSGAVAKEGPSGIATWTISPTPAGIEPAPGTYPTVEGKPLPSEPFVCKNEFGYNDEGTQDLLTGETNVTDPYCPQPADLVQLVCLDANREQVTIMVPKDHLAYGLDTQHATALDQGLIATNEEPLVLDCPLPPSDTSTGLRQNDVADTSGAVSEHSRKVLVGESRWRTVNVQGVDMIVIEVPVSVRHRLDEDEMAELLLIQDGEFVRRGARIGEQSVDDEKAYNAAAFDTLIPVIVDYISPSVVENRF